jgi:hypothetical protein
MKTSQKLICMIAVFCSTAALGQEKNKDAEMSAMEKAWMQYMTPGKAHTQLAQSEGIWMEEITMWMTADAPPLKSSSSVANKMIMGGRYLQGMHRGSFNGMPFEGMSTVGYDNKKEVYESTWIDNMGTGIMELSGKWDNSLNGMESKGTTVDPLTGGEVSVREVYAIKDNDHHTLDMFMTPADGKEFKSMHIDMTRRQMTQTKGISKQPPPRSAASSKEVKQPEPAKTATPAKTE